MKKLVQINFAQNFGSTGKIAEQIGELALSKGWESYIVSGRQQSDSRSCSLRINNRFELLWHIFFTHFADLDGRCSYFATKKLIRQLKSIKPDIVHLHVIHESFINYPVLFKYLKEEDVPVVWTFHDCWPLTGHCPHFDYIGCEKWKELCKKCPAKKNYRKLEFFNNATSNHRQKKYYFGSIEDKLTIVPVSKWLGGKVQQSYLKNCDIEVIHNGIDINVFKPQEMDVHKRYDIGKEKKIILGVASFWSDMKGLRDFYQLAAELDPENYAIVIVGAVSEKRQSIEHCCQMVFVDRTQNSLELAQLYSSATVFVNPTYQDSYPTTNLEAIACGTPVVTYNTGGSPEAIDENTGIIVEQGDVNSLVKAIERLSSTSSQVACRKRAEELFDNNKCFNSYITLYNKLLGGGKIVIMGVASMWGEGKGLMDYIELSSLLPSNYLIVLVGVTKAQKEVLPHNIIGIERTQNQHELAQLYSMADILLSLSKGETFGMTIAEAYGCGTPCIVYDNTAQPEIVSGNTGRTVKTGDIEALAKEVCDMTNSNFKVTHTNDCRKFAEDYFDKNKCYEKYIGLYEEMMNRW